MLKRLIVITIIFFIGSALFGMEKKFKFPEYYLKSEEGQELIKNLVEKKNYKELATLYYLDGIDEVYKTAIKSIDTPKKFLYSQEFYDLVMMIINFDNGEKNLQEKGSLALLNILQEHLLSTKKERKLLDLGETVYSDCLETTNIMCRVISTPMISSIKKKQFMDIFLNDLGILDPIEYITCLVKSALLDDYTQLLNTFFDWRFSSFWYQKMEDSKNFLIYIICVCKGDIKTEEIGKVMARILRSILTLENKNHEDEESEKYVLFLQKQSLDFFNTAYALGVLRVELLSQEKSEYIDIFKEVVSGENIDSAQAYKALRLIAISKENKSLKERELLIKTILIDKKKQDLEVFKKLTVMTIEMLCDTGYTHLLNDLVNEGCINLYDMFETKLGSTNIITAFCRKITHIDLFNTSCEKCIVRDRNKENKCNQIDCECEFIPCDSCKTEHAKDITKRIKKVLSLIKNEDDKIKLLNPTERDLSPLIISILLEKGSRDVCSFLIKAGALPETSYKTLCSGRACYFTVLNETLRVEKLGTTERYELLEMFLKNLKKNKKIDSVLKNESVESPIITALRCIDEHIDYYLKLLFAYGAFVPVGCIEKPSSLVGMLGDIERTNEYDQEIKTDKIKKVFDSLRRTLPEKDFEERCVSLLKHKKLLPLTWKIIFDKNKNDEEANKKILKNKRQKNTKIE